MKKFQQKKYLKIVMLVLALLSLSPSLLFAQKVLKGKVLDETGEGLAGAAVQLKSGKANALTVTRPEISLPIFIYNPDLILRNKFSPAKHLQAFP